MKRLSVVLLALTLLACGARTPAGTLRRTQQEGTRISYEGTLRLSGRYEHRQDPPTLEVQGDQLCFFPDPASAHLIPRGVEDPRAPWFCFSNRDRALAQLSLSAVAEKGTCGVEGTATVLVSNYIVDRAETATFDTAQLDEVSQASAPVPLSCSGKSGP